MPSSSLANSTSAWIVGIDLAWGEKKGDGLCLFKVTRQGGEVRAIDHTFGDIALLAWLKQNIPESDPALLLIDAPLIIKNQMGSRPVDRETSKIFYRESACCHSANLVKCPRPARIGQVLEKIGYRLDYNLEASSRLAAEVYPHPAMVRLFQLDQIVRYKKGLVAQKKLEFARLQNLIKKSLAKHFPQLALDSTAAALLNASWSKPIEDRTDALFCALIGYYHWLHRGQKSQVIGDVEAGFILLPAKMCDLVS